MAVDIFIPDIHADPDSFRNTLIKANLAYRKHGDHGELTFHDPGLHELIFTGDFLDRGPANVETLDILEAVMEEFQDKVTVLLGNHEAIAVQAFAHPEEAEWMGEWMEGVPLLIEVANREHLKLLSRPMMDAGPLADHRPSMEVKGTARYLAEWNRMMTAHPDWQNIDFPEAFGRAQDLFLGQRYRLLFEQMKIAHRVKGILAVHAGMNEKGVALGVERLNELYREAIQKLDIGYFIDFDWQKRKGMPHAPLSELLCMTKPLPPNDRPLLQENVVNNLYQRGDRVLIHGHAAIGPRLQNPGVQQCNDMYGKMPDMNGDIVMTRWHKDFTGSDYGFIQYDEETGKITAENPKTGTLDFGTLIGNEYVFPKKDL